VEPGKLFPSNVPIKNKLIGFTPGDRGGQSADPLTVKTFYQLNYEHISLRVVVLRRAGTTRVLWWPDEGAPAVLAVRERVVCEGSKAFRQEIWTNDIIS
jgi:hypothetical protein